MKLKPILLLVGVLGAAASLSAQSQIQVTFSGTADANELGYTDGQEVSFTFVLGTGSPTYTIDDPNKALWEDFGGGGNQLVQSVSGTGITGSWLSPVDTAGGGGATSALQVQRLPNEYFRLYIASFDYSGPPVNVSGLQANGFDLGQLEISAYGSNPVNFGSLVTSSSHNTYLTDYIGSYSGSFSASMYDIGDNYSLDFSITNVTISAYSAVPEPATYAVIFGAMALGGTIFLRRRRL